MSENGLENAIEENAMGPKKASGDAGSVEQHPIADQIEADRYAAAVDGVARTSHRGVRFNKVRSPGAP